MIEAVVQTGSSETRYRRAGRGDPVVLLVDPAGGRLFEALADRFRVVAPARPAHLPAAGPGGPDGAAPGAGPDADALGEWLRGVIDGLGLQRPALVGDDADAAALLRFAASDPDRVARLALLRLGPAGDAPTASPAELIRFLEAGTASVWRDPGP